MKIRFASVGFMSVVCIMVAALGCTAHTLAADMALIPAGSFAMGNDTNLFPELYANELPMHSVYVSAFYMDRHEVSYTLWSNVHAWAITHGYTFENAGTGKATNHPVRAVDWYNCVKWCNARSEMEGLMPCYYTDTAQTQICRIGQISLSNECVKWAANGYRLPTEAEWEKAARGGTPGHRFPWSDADTISHDRANYNANTNTYAYDVSTTLGQHPTFAPYTSPVGYFAPNGYGLYDMAGNAWEWTWDRYDGAWYGNVGATQGDTRGPVSGTGRVLRGGQRVNGANYTRCACRIAGTPDSADDAVGFRCVRRYTGPGSGDYCVVDVSAGPTATNYPVSYFTGTSDLDDEYKTTKILLRKIPGGSFSMGSPAGELGRYANETQHTVTLTRDFYIGVFEITRAQWTNVIGGSNPSDATRPIELVSWVTIRGGTWPGGAPSNGTFMSILRTKTGLALDLPTEAQWEYACRAGTTNALNNNTDLVNIHQDPNLNIVARYFFNGGYGNSTTVGSYQVNNWGLYDMHGNVWELCLDWLQDDLGTNDVTDPVGPGTGTVRMSRGGSTGDHASECRSAMRAARNPDLTDVNIGFRLCMAITVPSRPSLAFASDGIFTNKIALTWTESSNATKYTVWRNTSASTNGASNISGDITATSYDDTAVVPSTTYWYWVKAGNAAGWSEFSAGDSGYAGFADTPTDMALIPAGPFAMGDTFGEGNVRELPVHSVYISAFYMDKYEVSCSLWSNVHAWAASRGYTFDNAGTGKATNHPVHTVSWYDCVK